MHAKKKQYAVIGLGRFGITLATTLFEEGEDVMAIDIDPVKVEEIRANVTHAIQADAMDRDALAQMGIRDFDVCVVSVSTDIKASGMITMLVKELGVPFVIAKAHDDVHGRMLFKLGADKVIFPERDSGRRVAHNLISGNILDFIELSPDYSLVELQPPDAWHGRTLADLDLRNRYNMNVIAIRRAGEVNPAPSPDTALLRNDRLLVMSSRDSIEKIRSR